LLREAGRRVLKAGYSIGNIDATIIAQAPKLAAHLPAMRQNLASDLALDIAQINLKAKTNEHLGWEGREEGIAVQAIALLEME
jgi:2-C-methyl-D-erythritol 2,4-cyclodiphosphate synthase